MKQLESNQQLLFLKQIENQLPKQTSLVQELAELLNISIDSSYRRLRGETALTFNEIVILCEKFNISFDTFIKYTSEANNVSFKFYKLESTVSSFKNYLLLLLKDLTKLHKSQDSSILYAAEDIPIFYHFRFPQLAAFKSFYWMKSVLYAEGFKDKLFSFREFDDEILKICTQMADLYEDIPRSEIWTELTINSIISQIEFFWESGVFKTPEEALKTCEILIEEINYIKKVAEKAPNNKEDMISFSLYKSDVEIGNNCILANVNTSKSVYLTHFTFNMIYTSDLPFCNQTNAWFNNLMQKSSLISGISEKARNIFFNEMQAKVEKLLQNITIGRK